MRKMLDLSTVSSRPQCRCAPQIVRPGFGTALRWYSLCATTAALIVMACLQRPVFGGQEQAPKLAALRGEYTAVVRVLRGDGKSAAGARWQVSFAYTMPAVTIAEGIIPDSGLVEVGGLFGPEIGLKMPDAPFPDYDFRVSGETAGIISMYVNPPAAGEILPLPGGAKRKEYTFYVAPMPNDIAPDVELVDLNSSRPLHLSDVRGQVVVLAIWGAGCHACPRTLQQIDALAHRRSDWTGRVTIFSASVDDNPQEALDAMRRHGLSYAEPVLRYCWAPSEAQRARDAKVGCLGLLYHPPQLPAVYLIDQTGRIISRDFRMDLEQEIGKLTR